MQKITFMIGNGFDMQLGLATGYDQFLKWYVEQPSDNENIGDYKQELRNDRNSLWWYDAEMAMGRHVANFDPKTLDLYYERVRDFKIKLHEYIVEQEEKCDYADTRSIGAKFKNFILNFQRDILLPSKVGDLFSQKQSTTYNFINFNYTRTLNRLISAAKGLQEHGNLYVARIDSANVVRGIFGAVVAVHGTLGSSIIMGVNDDSQLDMPQEDITQKLRRTLIKSETNDALGRIEDERAESLIRDSDIIAIYGLSLGETDVKWRNLVGDWLKYDSHKVVLFGHKGMENANPVIPEDVLDYVEEKQNEFIKRLYPDIVQTEIEELRDRVFIIDKTKFLDFSVVPKKQIAVAS